MKTNPNDPINLEPYNGDDRYLYNNQMPGLTKREYFAALALQGLLACPTGSNSIENAVRIADKLIEELNKEVK